MGTCPVPGTPIPLQSQRGELYYHPSFVDNEIGPQEITAGAVTPSSSGPRGNRSPACSLSRWPSALCRPLPGPGNLADAHGGDPARHWGTLRKRRVNPPAAVHSWEARHGQNVAQRQGPEDPSPSKEPVGLGFPSRDFRTPSTMLGSGGGKTGTSAKSKQTQIPE